MKLFVGALFLTVVWMQYVSAKLPDFITPEMLVAVADDKKRCMNTHGTTVAQVDKVNDGVLTNEKSITCYMLCFLETYKLVDTSGNIVMDNYLAQLPAEMRAEARKAVEACGKTTADPCDRMFDVASCLNQQMPGLWFIV